MTCDDPACRVIRLNFHDRMDHPRDEASPSRQGRLLAAMLIIAAASRDFRIDRLERLHMDQAAVRETVPRRHTRSSLLQSAAASVVALDLSAIADHSPRRARRLHRSYAESCGLPGPKMLVHLDS
jgi:hypothetical protein